MSELSVWFNVMNLDLFWNIFNATNQSFSAYIQWWPLGLNFILSLSFCLPMTIFFGSFLGLNIQVIGEPRGKSPHNSVSYLFRDTSYIQLNILYVLILISKRPRLPTLLE